MLRIIAVQSSVETELTRLLTDGGLAPSLAQGIALPRTIHKRHSIDWQQPDRNSASKSHNRCMGASVVNKTTVAQQAKTASFLPPAQGILQRKCACGNHTVAGGECAECAKNKSGLQRKLAIGASNDPLEREADRVADQVMAAPAHSAVSGCTTTHPALRGASDRVDGYRARQRRPRPCQLGQAAGPGATAGHGAALRPRLFAGAGAFRRSR